MPVSKPYNLGIYAAVMEFFHSHNWRTSSCVHIFFSSHGFAVMVQNSTGKLIGIETVKNRAIILGKITINSLIWLYGYVA